MKQIIRIISINLLFLFICTKTLATQQPLLHPIPPTINAQSYILMDANSGKILAAKNPDKKLPPASLTKLMSMYVISDSLKRGIIHLDDKVRISKTAWKTAGSRMFIKANAKIKVSDLLQGIIIVSGNDATVAMAEYIAGTEKAFTELMNAQAQQLGMKNSHFNNSNGLPNSEHYSSAHDLAILSKAIINDFPEEYKIYSQKWFKWNKIKQPNRNRLLWHFPNTDGLKTGYTNKSGFCLVASAKRGTTRLISVIMGEPTDAARTEDSIRLLTYGFRFFNTKKIYSAKTPITKARVWGGTSKEIQLGLQSPLFITLQTGQFEYIKTQFNINYPLQAPLEKNHSYGRLDVKLDNKIIASSQLIALSSNQKGGIFRRITDNIHFKINKIFTKHKQASDG